MANCFFSLDDIPSSFFSNRKRAGLFLNKRFTCVAECLDRWVILWVEVWVLLSMRLEAMAEAPAIRGGAGEVVTLTTSVLEIESRGDMARWSFRQWLLLGNATR